MSVLLKYFDRVYVVSLPTRVDRRRHIANQLKLAQMPLSPGRVEIFDAIAPPDAGGFPNIGARGCFLSHLGILELAERDALDSVLIIEDDLTFATDFLSRVERAMSDADAAGWDLVYLGYESKQLVDGSPVLVPDHTLGIGCTHFYGSRKLMRRALIRFLHEVLNREPGSPLGGPMHVDGAYSFFRAEHPEFRTVLVQPPLGYQGSSASDISPRWFDRVPVLRSASIGLRRLKNKFGRFR